MYSGNAGCGVWIMAANQPLIHGNEIHSNRDSGISLVNRMVGCLVLHELDDQKTCALDMQAKQCTET